MPPPEKRVAVFDSGDTWDDPALVWGPLPPEAAVPVLLPTRPFSLNSQTTMEYWEVTKDRAQKTLPPWQEFTPTITIQGTGVTAYSALIGQFEPLVQARVVAQDEVDEAYRAVQAALLKMKLLGTTIPGLITLQLDDHLDLMADVNDLYGNPPRTPETILMRARMLHPVWLDANAVAAGLAEPLPPFVRQIQGIAHTAVMLKALLDGHGALVEVLREKERALKKARENLRKHDRVVDQLNKRWYKYIKLSFDPGSDAYIALEAIPTEPSTPPPEVIEIDTVTQGGEAGLQVLIAYEPGGGAHATTKKIKWGVAGVDTGTPHEAPLDASGNALGPFQVGQVVTVIAEVSNSSGTRTTAPRTITIAEPIL